MSTAQLYTDNIPRFAHAGACDTVINFADWKADHEVPAGSHALLLGTGPNLWAVSLLRKL